MLSQNIPSKLANRSIHPFPHSVHKSSHKFLLVGCSRFCTRGKWKEREKKHEKSLHFTKVYQDDHHSRRVHTISWRWCGSCNIICYSVKVYRRAFFRLVCISELPSASAYCFFFSLSAAAAAFRRKSLTISFLYSFYSYSISRFTISISCHVGMYTKVNFSHWFHRTIS